MDLSTYAPLTGQEEKKKPAPFTPYNTAAQGPLAPKQNSPNPSEFPSFKPADQMMEETRPLKTTEELRAERAALTEQVASKYPQTSSDTELIYDNTSGSVKTTNEAQRATARYEQKKTEPKSPDAPWTIAPMEISHSQLVGFIRTFEASGQRTLTEKREMASTLARMRKGEYESKEQQEEDFAKVAMYIGDAPWKTTKPGYDGTNRVNRKSGGKDVEAMVGGLIRDAGAKVMASIADQEFSTGEEMADWVATQTGTPGRMVLDQLATQEARKARAMGIDNPASQSALFPVLSAIARTAQKEQLAFELDARKQTQEQDLEFQLQTQLLLGDQKTTGTKKSITAGTSLYRPKNGAIELGEEEAPYDPYSIFTSTEPATVTNRKPYTDIAKFNSENSGKYETAREYETALIKHLHDNGYDNLTKAAAEDLLNQPVGQAVTSFSNQLEANEIDALNAQIGQTEATLAAMVSAHGNDARAAFPVEDRSNPNKIIIASRNDYILGVFEQLGASDDLLEEVNLFIMTGETRVDGLDKMVGIFSGYHKSFEKIAKEEIAAEGHSNLANIPAILGAEGTEIISSNRNESLIRKDSEGNIIYAPLDPKEMKNEIANGIYILNKDKNGYNFPTSVIGVKDLPAEEQNVVYDVQRFLTNPELYKTRDKDGVEIEKYPGLKTKIDSAIAEGLYNGEYLIQEPGYQTPQKLSILNGDVLANALISRGVYRIPEPGDYSDLPEGVRGIAPYLTPDIYQALIAPDPTLKSIVVSAEDQKKLLEGISNHANIWAKTPIKDRSLDNLYSGHGISGSSGLENVPGPFADIASENKKVFSKFIKNIIDSDTKDGEAIRALLNSSNVQDVKKGFSMLYKAGETYMRLPLTSTALAFADYGLAVESDLAVIKNGLDDTNVEGYINYVSGLVSGSIPEQDFNIVVDDAIKTIASISKGYDSIGDDVAARRAYQDKYRSVIDNYSATVTSALETMDKQGMTLTREGKSEGPYAKSYSKLEEALLSASERLNEDPSLGSIITEIGRIKYILDHPQIHIDEYGKRMERDMFRDKLEKTLEYYATTYNLDIDKIPEAEKNYFMYGDKKIQFGKVPLPDMLLYLREGGIHSSTERMRKQSDIDDIVRTM